MRTEKKKTTFAISFASTKATLTNSTSSNALLIAKYEAFDFFDIATYTAASAKIILASGIPTW